MTRHSWIIWVLLVILLQICAAGSSQTNGNNTSYLTSIRDCYTQEKAFIVADTFYGNISAKTWNQSGNYCTVFVKTNGTKMQNYSSDIWKLWPEINKNINFLLYISRWLTNNKLSMYILHGKDCNFTNLNFTGSTCNFSYTNTNSCQIGCIRTKEVCQKAPYNETYCNNMAPNVQDYYIIDISKPTSNCVNCNNPVKKPEKEITLNETLVEVGKEVSGATAATLMNSMQNLVGHMTGSSAAISAGNGITGVLVRETQKEDVQEVSFAYMSPNDSINVIENRESLKSFSRSVTVPKEAFDKAVDSNVTVPFAALLRFPNLVKDEKNSTVLGDEIIAIEMGAEIANLTDKININFKSITYKGIPSCHSWNGEGSQPNWTADGCVTNTTGDDIVCQCSHLTFFAILLAPLNETIPSDDFNRLTIITQVSCGLSMFFLAVVLFMHFLSRQVKASYTTKMLINLVFALFMLNFTFLINNYVAKLKNDVGCKIMAAVMHYFLLATFTWFAAQAFHLCLNLYKNGKIAIHHYLMKVAITSWVLPSVIGIVLLSIGKYGEQVVHTQDSGNPDDDVLMCWITDNSVYVINIVYYAFVFIITFTTFIIMTSWLCRLKNVKGANVQGGQNGSIIMSIMGLCFMLGITWGVAFFAHGSFLIPAYFIFTILNSLQGFFLFIFYYKTSRIAPAANQNSTNINSNTIETSIDGLKNPYNWLDSK